MGATEAIIKMAKENNGTVTTAMDLRGESILMKRHCFYGI